MPCEPPPTGGTSDVERILHKLGKQVIALGILVGLAAGNVLSSNVVEAAQPNWTTRIVVSCSFGVGVMESGSASVVLKDRRSDGNFNLTEANLSCGASKTVATFYQPDNAEVSAIGIYRVTENTIGICGETGIAVSALPVSKTIACKPDGTMLGSVTVRIDRPRAP